MIREMIPTHLFSRARALHKHLMYHVTPPHKHASCANRNSLLACQAANLRALAKPRDASSTNQSPALRPRAQVPQSRERVWEIFHSGVRYYSVPHKTVLACRTLTLLRAHRPAFHWWNWARELKCRFLIGPWRVTWPSLLDGYWTGSWWNPGRVPTG